MESEKQKYMRMLAAAKSERQQWEPTWQELSDLFCPYSYQRDKSQENKGERRDDQIIDSVGIEALRVASTGIYSNMTRPDRKWFTLEPRSKELRDDHAVESWLSEVGELIRAALARSNFYASLPEFYRSFLSFGTTAMFFEEAEDDRLFRFKPWKMGTYYLAQNDDREILTASREFTMTAASIQEKFPRGEYSEAVKTAIASGKLEQKFDILHVIKQNPDWQPDNPFRKPFLSCYFEATTNADDRFLDKSGYDEFPLITARWDTEAGDTWGRGPALDALADLRQLQAYSEKTGAAVDKTIDPPLSVPASMDLTNISLLPGALNQEGDHQGDKQLRPVHAVQYRIDHAVALMDRLAEKVRRLLFNDLFKLLASRTGEMTAREIAERIQEKLDNLGPILLKASTEAFDPLIGRCLAIMNRRGELPEPPPQLLGERLKVEYQSVLVQGQKKQDAIAIEEHVAFVSGLASVDSSVLDTLDTDEIVRAHGRNIGVDPKAHKDKDEVDAIRMQRAQQQAEAQRMAEAEQTANVASKLAGANTADKNALTDLSKAMVDDVA